MKRRHFLKLAGSLPAEAAFIPTFANGGVVEPKSYLVGDTPGEAVVSLEMYGVMTKDQAMRRAKYYLDAEYGMVPDHFSFNCKGDIVER